MLPPLCTLSEKEIESLYVYGHRNPDNLRKLCDQALLALQLASKYVRDPPIAPIVGKESWREAAEAAMKDYITRGLSVTRIAPEDYLKESVAMPAWPFPTEESVTQVPATARPGTQIAPDTATPAVTDPTPRVDALIHAYGKDFNDDTAWRNLENGIMELERENLALQRQVAELKHSFDIRFKADMRAIKQWQIEQSAEVWPDHADLCVWLTERLSAAQSELARVREAAFEEDAKLCDNRAYTWTEKAALYPEHSKIYLTRKNEAIQIASAIRAKLKEGT